MQKHKQVPVKKPLGKSIKDSGFLLLS